MSINELEDLVGCKSCGIKEDRAGLRSAPELRRYHDVRELIASPKNPTPLVRLNRVTGTGDLEIYLKLEWFNPFGSIKDRPALYMTRALEDSGRLEGKGLVEATSGNTGIALAALAAVMGKKFTVMVPDAVPAEKKILLRMLGAEVWEAADDLCPIEHPSDGAIALARAYAKSNAGDDGCVLADQYNNPDNVRAHYENTGPEIWRQTEGKVKYFFAGFGTCGTLSGVGRYLKEQDPGVKIIAVEPQKKHRIPGLKNLEEAKTPSILDRSVIDEIIQVSDEQAYAMTKRLFREEGLIVGPSTGAMVHAAVGLGLKRSGLAVAISPDNGFKYTSFFAEILGEEGKPPG